MRLSQWDTMLKYFDFFFFFSVKGVNPRIQVLCDSKLSQDLSETVQSHEAWVQSNHHSQFQLGRRNIDPESIVLSQKTGCSLSSARKGNFIVLLLEMTEAYINTASESPALPSARNRNRLPQHLGRSGRCTQNSGQANPKHNAAQCWREELYSPLYHSRGLLE